MVIIEILAKNPALVCFVENDYMIQTISANGTDQTFNKRILPRRSRGCDNILDTQTLDPSLDGLNIDAITVSQ